MILLPILTTLFVENFFITVLSLLMRYRVKNIDQIQHMLRIQKEEFMYAKLCFHLLSPLRLTCEISLALHLLSNWTADHDGI